MLEMNRYWSVLLGVVFFGVSNKLLPILLPSCVLASSRQAWKWKNAANSLLHSVITGVGALVCFYLHPAMAEDLITVHKEMALHLVAFSVGYFIYDFYDMARYHHKRSSYELMGHHACVITCFGLAVVTQKYVGYAVVALLVEVNSIFLHWRQLLVVEGRPRSCSLYRLVALLNVATFLVFRIAVLGWMTRWLVLHSHVLPVPVYTLGSVAMAIVVLMNIVLFLRICSVDFIRRSRTAHEQGATDSTKVEGVVHTAAAALFAPNNTVPEVHLD